jgi:SdrD B-like domain/Secretion system C-terminal sorting domain
MKTFTSILVALFFLSATASAQTICLGNYIWWDMNDNGKKDGNEFGTGGLTVKLYQDNNEDGVADAGFTTLTTTTDGNGYYLFTNLAPAKYFVRLSAGYGHYKTTVYGGDPDNDVDGDNNGYTQNLTNYYVYSETVSLSLNAEPDGNGATNTNTNNSLDMGIWKGNGLGDFVWLDMNGNGAQDDGEPGISNVTVKLKDINGNVLATTITDSKGYYGFHDPANYGTTNYQVEFVTPAGYTPVTANAGADDKDSDAVGGVISNINVPIGEWNHSFDAGFRPLNGILPVRLYSFQAYIVNSKVELKWMSDYEKDAAHFAIEKSTDGRTFQQIGIVMAANSNDVNSSYQFSDNVNSEKGIFYYRLKMVDINGSFEYSEVKIIRTKSNRQNGISIQAYPNPVVSQLRVTIPQTWSNKKVTYQLIAANGLIVKAIQRTNSSQTELIDMNNFANGTYIVRVSCENESTQQLIVKQ